jgi:hypothetical protein
MEINLFAFVRAFDAGAFFVRLLPSFGVAGRMSEEARIILWFGVEDAAVIRRRTLAGLVVVVSGAWAAPLLPRAVMGETAGDHLLSLWAKRDAGRVGGEVRIELIMATAALVESDDGCDTVSAQ